MSYPRESVEIPAGLLEAISSFWQQGYHAPQEVHALLWARSLIANQQADRLHLPGAGLYGPAEEPTDLLFRWRAEQTSTSPASNRYQGGRRNDQDVDTNLPANVAGTALVQDRLLEPGRIDVLGVDHRGEAGVLASHQAWNQPTWLVGCQRNYQRAGDSLGPLLGRSLSTTTTPAAQTALLRAITGSSFYLCKYQLAQLSGVGCIQEEVETVELVGQDQYGTVVVTDRHSYRLGSGQSALVSVGQKLQRGDFLGDALRLLVPPVSPPADLVQIVLPAAWLDPSLGGSLTFVNAQVALSVQLGVNGLTKLSWSMPDEPSRVTAFFNLLHARGVAAGKSLANYLDRRPAPQTTEPTAASLPTHINPASLLLEQLGRNHWLVVLYKSSLLGSLSSVDQASVARFTDPSLGLLWIAI